MEFRIRETLSAPAQPHACVAFFLVEPLLRFQILLPGLFLVVTSCTQTRGWFRRDGVKPLARLTLTIKNPLALRRAAAPMILKADQLPSLFQQSTHIAVVDPYAGNESGDGHQGKLLPAQLDDLDGDGKWDELAFQVDLEDLQMKMLHLYSSLSAAKVDWKGADATTSSTHHITQMVLESEKITYTIAEAASLDVIGKLGPGFNIGFYFGKHKRSPNRERNADRGLDFLPVGTTFGAASFCVFEEPGTGKYARPWSTNSLFFSESDLPGGGAKFNFKIIKKGPVRAIASAEITNWKSGKGDYEARCRYTLWAKHQELKCDVELTRVPAGFSKFTAGIGFREPPQETSFIANKTYACATARDIYSVASGGIIADMIGLSLIYDANDFEKSELSKDAQKNHLIHFKNPGRRRFSYYALAGWNRDEAVQSPDQWKKLVAAVQEEIANPPQVNVGAVEY
ncbi:MAG: DUF4861 family protein [Planctomycetota bacterium]|jgi:hypothetical protein|nr:DUF4861 family protein [Planctomycetota bacterium]MDP7129299.1 DUF4861 family protein [Planctomycetota bacterium]MDP7249134.1 DUF4861 family protein [Planctomycetota bacterium]